MSHSNVKIEGFSRVRIRNSDGTIAGDSGWTGPNQITNLGVAHYLCANLGKTTNSKQVGFASLGEGGAPAAGDTTLESECSGTGGVVIRKTVSAASSGNTTEEFTVTFGSSDSFVLAVESISNIGLFASSAAGTLFAGNNYTSSSCATNQDVNATYQIRFATS